MWSVSVSCMFVAEFVSVNVVTSMFGFCSRVDQLFPLRVCMSGGNVRTCSVSVGFHVLPSGLLSVVCPCVCVILPC